MGKPKTHAPILPNSIKNLIRGSADPLSTAIRLRASLSLEQLPALVAWLANVTYKGQGVLPARYPSKYSELKRQLPFGPVSLDREIAWALGSFLREADQLSGFVQLGREFDRHLLAGCWKECYRTLDIIELRFGVSLWLIEAKVALIQAAEGLEKQKVFAMSVRDSAGLSLVSLIVFYLSQRNEGTINPFRFKSALSDFIKDWELREDLGAYLLFRLADKCPYDSSRIADIFRLEETSALVDYYETFVSIALHAIATECDVVPLFVTALRRLSKVIKDVRLNRAVYIADGQNSTTIEPAKLYDLKAFDLFATGDFNHAAREARQLLDHNEVDIATVILAAYATADSDWIDLKSAGIANRSGRLANTLIAKKQGFDDAYLELLRIALNFRFTSFAAAIKSVARSETSSNPRTVHPHALKAFFNSTYLDVSSARHLPEVSRNKYVLHLVAAYGATPSVQVAAGRAGVDISSAPMHEGGAAYSEHMRLEIEIGRALGEEQYSTALPLARSLQQATTGFIRRRGYRYEAYGLVLTGQLDELAQFIATNCLIDNGLVAMLPIEWCVKRFDKETRNRLAHKLSTSIVLDLYSRHYSDEFDNVRDYAYEDFLIANSIERPSELRDKVDHLDHDLLTYYLRFICVPEVMQISTVFDGSRDVEEERLRVCALLAEIDQKNQKTYELEIREITRQQVIQRGVREVERSKIFVDTVAIRKWAEKELKESFSRYRALLTAGMDAGATGFNEALERALGGGLPLPKEFLELPKNEASDLLVGMVSKLLIQCMVNPQHGLDCYLSMRIRHGALSGQLRQPLEDEKIITQRDSTSQEYKENEYWANRLAHLDWLVLRAVDDRLKRFSRDYDAFVDSIAKELIQINTPDKQKGLFSCVISHIRLRALATEIKPDTPFDTFVDLCFGIFWESLEDCLRGVRAVIETELKSQLNDLFVALETDFAPASIGAALPDLNRAIRHAQTGAQYALDRVEEWFQVVKPVTQPQFSFEELVEIGLQSVKNLHREFNPVLDVTAHTSRKFVNLTLFTDVFFIVFDNIQRHSGMQNPVVHVSAATDANRLTIRIESEVSPTSRTPTSEAKVTRIREAIQQGGYEGAVRSEGGTGLIKLRNIIGDSARSTNRLTFGFTGNNRFLVELDMGFVVSGTKTSE